MQEMERLQSHLGEIKALAEAAAVLGWDQQTYMPAGGAESRAAQLSALSRVIHEKMTGPESAEAAGHRRESSVGRGSGILMMRRCCGRRGGILTRPRKYRRRLSRR